jgi:pantoate--beta-alanine ligase
MLNAALKALAASADIAEEIQTQSALMEKAGWAVEYLAVVDAITLDHTSEFPRKRRAIGAAHLAGVRLIDNVPVPN